MRLCTRIIGCLGALVWFSCSQNRLDVDVSEIRIPETSITRLDSVAWAWSQYPEALDRDFVHYLKWSPVQHYAFSALIPPDSAAQPAAARRTLKLFVGNPDIRASLQRIHQLYSSKRVSELKIQLEDLLKHYRYYFPQDSLPQLVSVCSGWNYTYAPFKSHLLISLDMYLGDTCSLYSFLPFPKYQIAKMSPDYLPSDLARALLLIKTDRQPPGDFLLAHAVFYGKLFYGIKALLPKTEDRIILGYTPHHMEYLDKYEHALWTYFAQDNKWFAQDLKIIRAHTTEGPFTAAISKECPPRIAMWIGYRMVTAFMNRNSSVSLDSLFKIQDPHRIMRESAYKP